MSLDSNRNKEIRVGLIDDSAERIMYFISDIEDFNRDEGRYSSAEELLKNYTLASLPIEMKQDMYEMVDEIKRLNIDCIIADYNFSFGDVTYDGVEMLTLIREELFEYPVFLITSFQDDVYKGKIFDTCRVFDYKKYENDKTGMFNMIIFDVLHYRRKINQYKSELAELWRNQGKSASIDSKILSLDALLERTLDNKNAIPKEFKEKFITGDFEKLIKDVDQLINELTLGDIS